MLNPICSGGLNKSYEAQGCDSVPLTKDDAVIERDLAS